MSRLVQLFINFLKYTCDKRTSIAMRCLCEAWIKQDHINREAKIKLIIRQLLKTLVEMHKQNIVHRDIKPENVVFVQSSTTKTPSNGDDQEKDSKCYVEMKFIDFGEAIMVNDNETYCHLVGTPCYLAPERFRKHRGWELKEELQTKIGAGEWDMPQGCEPSTLCQHFISVLLTVNPEKRPSAKFALKHPWLVTNPKVFQRRLSEWNQLNDTLPKWSTYVP
ncbi:hypothetical protein RFI_20727 [Reticulomyxa filosa]|uniref:Protein kinase domain-containing protein n=1 Tax=Reticulomyxa filosa TaxID=46433 RepID=X6MT33_RETFI|nr:hypothetical protein RFI_20727 [Reticulomyxa filosa]|eukprot:ETO16612.1 hypothetical protein RFI_20727 [Reticulomyxa filosa]